MSTAWHRFFDEIARWREAGRTVDFWWRDDDACRPEPALTRLLALATSFGVPLALAVIPDAAQAGAFEVNNAVVTVLQHGVDHRNRATGHEKKTEFPASEPVAAALARLERGRARLELLAVRQAMRVLVPPWNRMSSPALVGQLADAGYRGLSTFGPRSSQLAAPGLLLVNTHVDIIDWRGGRGFVGEDVALGQATRHLQARRSGLADGAEPTGWLTHHAVHDESAWVFLQQLFERTAGRQGVSWRSATDLFVQQQS